MGRVEWGYRETSVPCPEFPIRMINLYMLEHPMDVYWHVGEAPAKTAVSFELRYFSLPYFMPAISD